MGSYVFSPDIVISSHRKGFQSKHTEKGIVNVVGKSEQINSYQFRSGDTLPPSVTASLIQAGSQNITEVHGTIEVLLPIRNLPESSSSEVHLRVIATLAGDNNHPITYSGRDSYSICRKISLADLSTIQKEHSQVYLRAAASDNGNPFASLTLSPLKATNNSIKQSSEVNKNHTNNEKFAHLQLPIPLWREILATFGDQHVNNTHRHHRHHHWTKTNHLWTLHSPQNFVNRSQFSVTLKSAGLCDSQLKAVELLVTFIDAIQQPHNNGKNGQNGHPGEVNVPLVCMCDQIINQLIEKHCPNSNNNNKTIGIDSKVVGKEFWVHVTDLLTTSNDIPEPSEEICSMAIDLVEAYRNDMHKNESFNEVKLVSGIILFTTMAFSDVSNYLHKYRRPSYNHQNCHHSHQSRNSFQGSLLKNSFTVVYKKRWVDYLYSTINRGSVVKALKICWNILRKF
mmetsp:Transcript_19161/g.27398  ORF Transcript_19161/g.27398 Transcript_19161/m.27398 type:complete len:453 (-) Transcript_19161:64-1422(-)